MSNYWRIFLILGLMTGGVGCSSSKTVQENRDQYTLEVTAGTDKVPEPSAGQPEGEGEKHPSIEMNGEPSSQPTPEVTGSSTPEMPVAPPVAQEEAPNSSVNSTSPEEVVHQINHTVRPGDTLMKIAFEVYGDLFRWKEIYEENKQKIKKPAELEVGLVLILKSPEKSAESSRQGHRYLIKAGDTLGTISQDVYGTPKKWKRIWKNNQTLIKNPNEIFAGFTLYYKMTEKDRQDYQRLKSQKQTVTEVKESEMGPPLPVPASQSEPPQVPVAAKAETTPSLTHSAKDSNSSNKVSSF